MSSTQIQNVQFKGSATDLHALIGGWNVLKGVSWNVAPADYVGGSFNVTFKRHKGSITKAEAQGWVDEAIRHAND